MVPYRSVYEDPVNYVRLEVDDDGPAGVASQRACASEGHARRGCYLASSAASRSKNIGSGCKDGCKARRHWCRRFALRNSALLSRQIAEAFAAAKPDERVTFYLSQPQTSVKRIITTGGMYVHGTELHFILGNWQILYGIPTYGMIYDRRYPMRPTAAKGFDLSSSQKKPSRTTAQPLGYGVGKHDRRTRDRSDEDGLGPLASMAGC